MPKMKTNRSAYKKYRVSARGKVSHARAFTSHNSGKKSAKRIRHLKHMALVDDTNTGAIRRQLPYLNKHKR